MPLVCTKVSAAGNDFLCIDHRCQHLPLDKEKRTWIASLCHRRFGLGADGVLLWESTPHADMRMRLFNADGSEADMCGNGLRAICLFASINGFEKPFYRIQTPAGIYVARYEATQEGTNTSPYSACITTSMPLAKNFIENIPLHTPQGALRMGHFVHVGVPHLLLFLDEATSYSLEEEGAHFCSHPHFAPEGVNVHFIKKRQDGWHYRSYERGVESETWACGTGATAIAAYLIRNHLATLPLKLMPYSGIPLTVQPATFDSHAELELQAEAIALFTLSITPQGLCTLPSHPLAESLCSIPF